MDRGKKIPKKSLMILPFILQSLAILFTNLGCDSKIKVIATHSESENSSPQDVTNASEFNLEISGKIRNLTSSSALRLYDSLSSLKFVKKIEGQTIEVPSSIELSNESYRILSNIESPSVIYFILGDLDQNSFELSFINCADICSTDYSARNPLKISRDLDFASLISATLISTKSKDVTSINEEQWQTLIQRVQDNIKTDDSISNLKNVAESLLSIRDIAAIIQPVPSIVTVLPPNAPAFTTPFNINDTPQIVLSWHDLGAGVTYILERAPQNGSCGNFSEISLPAEGITSFTDNTVNFGQSYCYRLAARNAGGKSPYSTAEFVILKPSVPILQGISNLTDVSVQVNWTDSLGEVNYILERAPFSTTCGTFTQIANLVADSTSFSDTTLTSGFSYCYRVKSSNSSGESIYSATVQITTLSPAPGIQAISLLTETSVQINWTDVTGETSYSLERAPFTTTCGTYAEIATPVANATSYGDSALTGGSTYCYRLKALNAAGSSAYSSPLQVTLLPSAPTMQAVSLLTDTSVQINWTDVAGETGYSVERAPYTASCGTYAAISSPVTDATSFGDSGLSGGTTYCYRVRASNGSGYGNYSATVQVTTLPAAPTLQAASLIAETSVQINWTDVTGETSYSLERAPFTTTCGTYAEIATPVANATSYGDSALTGGSTYCYRLKALNAAGSSAYSSPLQVTLLPSAPTMQAVSLLTDTSVQINWTDVTGETGYSVERAPYTASCGTYVEIATPAANATSYNNSLLTSGTTYCYRVRASNGSGYGNYSATVQVTTLPAAPTLQAASLIAETSVQINWTDVTGETSYSLERAPFTTTCGTYAEIATPVANATSYGDSALTGGSTYCYRLKALNAAGSSAYSSPLQVTLLPAVPIMQAVSLLTDTSVQINWTDVTGETGYSVERAPYTASCGTYVEIATPAANATSYNNSLLTSGTTYCYRVRASNGSGYGNYSATVQVTTLPAAPTLQAASLIAETSVQINWTDVTGETSYSLERAPFTTSCGTYAEIATPVANATSFGDSALTGGNTYCYRMKAINGGGSGANSSVLQVTLLPAAPTMQAVSLLTDTSVQINWTDVTGETGYSLERAPYTASCGTYAAISSPVTDATSFGDSGLSGGTTYCYRIKASNGVGSGGYSSVVQVTTLLPAPTSTSATGGISANSITWSSVTGADSYTIFWGTSTGVTSSSTAIANATPTYNHTGLTGGTTYYYRIAAIKSGVVGMLSSEISSIAYIGTSSDPTVLPAAGTFGCAQAVTLESTTSGVSIRYTTDGSTPSPTVGTIYTEPVTVKTSQTLKSVAYSSTYAPSGVTSSTYTINANGCTFSTVQRSPTAEYLYGIASNGATSLVGVGATGTIVTTTDGSTWAAKTKINTNKLRAVTYATSTNGYAVGDNGTVLKTTDSGVTWTAGTSAGSTTLDAVNFPTSTVGYVAGWFGYMYKTTNGGTSWTSVTTGTTNEIFAIQFIDANTGWIAGYSGIIRKTTDGGTTWTTQTSGTTNQITSMFFLDANTGWISGINGVLLKTTDGGTTWTSIVPTGLTTTFLNSVHFADVNNGWFVGAGGKAYRTSDGGTNWTAASLSIGSNSLYGVIAKSLNNAYVIGGNGLIYSTADGGTTWTASSSGNISDIKGIHVADQNTVVTAGSGGVVVKTTDGGTTWNTLSPGTATNMTDISMNNASTIWALTSTSASLPRVSSDGGTTWNTLTLPGSSTYLYDIQFLNSTTGWIAGGLVTGSFGSVYRTTDAGANWTQSNLATAYRLLSVNFIDANTGWVSGNTGFIAKSTDGGATWTSQTSGITSNINRIFFKTANFGIAVADNGNVLRTTNGGSTWSVAFTTSYILKGLLFLNSDIIWVGGNGGYVIQSSDGGVTWTQQPFSTTQNMTSIQNYKNTIWMVGDGGTVLRGPN